MQLVQDEVRRLRSDLESSQADNQRLRNELATARARVDKWGVYIERQRDQVAQLHRHLKTAQAGQQQLLRRIHRCVSPLQQAYAKFERDSALVHPYRKWKSLHRLLGLVQTLDERRDAD